MKKLVLFLLMLLLPQVALADLDAYFLDVGHGDCTVITCDGEAMIIDGGVSGCSQQVFSFLQRMGIKDIKYAVATHPDADHIGGLPAAFHAANVHTLLSPVAKHSDSRFETLAETAEKAGVPVTVTKAGDAFPLGSAQITVLSPAISFADTNDMSIVLRIDHGERSFIFTGDASTAVEKDLIARKANLDADVLKVSHHGSNTGTSQIFVQAVSPEYAVISCAETATTPSWEVLYALAETHTLITAQKGAITLHSDGSEITVQFAQAQAQTVSYIGNKNSKVFHYNTCGSVDVMKDKNKVYFDSKEQAESKGYHPCKNCSP